VSEVVGEPLVFGQLSVGVLVFSAPDRTGKPMARTLVRPHPARPCVLRSQTNDITISEGVKLLKLHALLYLLGN
jgi:hypothetical protein